MKILSAIFVDIIKTFKHVFISLFIDFLPILTFIYFAQKGNLYKATSMLMLVAIVTTVITYVREKRLPYITLYVSFITIFFGMAALHRHDIQFVQMRDTLYDVSLFLAFSIGLLLRVSVLKISLHKVFSLTDKGWTSMTYGWCVFFLITACINEYTRRFRSFDDWLLFKEILVPVTIFTALFLYGLAIYDEKKKELASGK